MTRRGELEATLRRFQPSEDPSKPFYEPPQHPLMLAHLEGLECLESGVRLSAGAIRRMARANATAARKALADSWEMLGQELTLEAAEVCLQVKRMVDLGDQVREVAEPLPFGGAFLAPGVASGAFLESTTTTNVGKLSDAGTAAFDAFQKFEAEALESGHAREVQARARLEALAIERAEARPYLEALAVAESELDTWDAWADDGGSTRWLEDLRKVCRRKLSRLRRLQNAAGRLTRCGSEGTVALCPNDGTPLRGGDNSDGDVLMRGSNCECQGCPDCDPKRSGERAEKLVRKINVWNRREANASRREQRAPNFPKLLTLQARDIPGEGLHDAITRMRGNFARFRSSSEFGRYIRGYIIRWEITRNDEGPQEWRQLLQWADDGGPRFDIVDIEQRGWWHVHAHLLVVGEYWTHKPRTRVYDASDPALVDRFALLNAETGELETWEPGLRATWEDAVGGTAGADIRAIRTEDAIKECCKYVVKPSGYTAPQLVEITRAILGQRLFESGGCLRIKEAATMENPMEQLEPECESCGRVYPSLRHVFWLSHELAKRWWTGVERASHRIHHAYVSKLGKDQSLDDDRNLKWETVSPEV